MSETLSTMKMNLGEVAPEFKLFSPSLGKEIALTDYQEKTGYLIIFMCNHCPFVIHLAKAISELTRAYASKKIITIGINSNDASIYLEDSPKKMKEETTKRNYSFPYLYDENQKVAKLYKAACTPDFFLFNQDKKLHYRGQFDESRPGNEKPITGKSLRFALENLLMGNPPLEKQSPSIGCNIKWKPGLEPDYYLNLN